MPNKTENIQLNQWEPEDDFLRTDFNEDNAKLEAALSDLQSTVPLCTRVTFGNYTGSGARDDTSHISISLGFRARLVIALRNDGRWFVYDDAVYGAIAFEGGSCGPITITDMGFEVWNVPNSSYMNNKNLVYNYIVFY